MKRLLLVKWSGNYADEFTMEGFRTMTLSAYETWIEKLRNFKNPMYVYFGTNEYYEWQSGMDLVSELSTEYITEEECDTLEKLLGGQYGYEFPFEVGTELKCEDLNRTF